MEGWDEEGRKKRDDEEGKEQKIDWEKRKRRRG